MTEYACRPGRPFPQGASWDGHGTNFSLFSENAERVELCLIDEDGSETGSTSRTEPPSSSTSTSRTSAPGSVPGDGADDHADDHFDESDSTQ